MTEPADELHAAESEEWRGILTGTSPYIAKWRPRFSTLPSPPRCKVCAAPFAGPGKVITRLTGHRLVPGNPLLCNRCFVTLGQHPGGAEVDVSVLFADIRGSTGLAEKVGAARFRHLLQSYYAKASAAIESSDGIVDKLLGDGVMALFIPVIAGENHRLRAIEAGRRVIRAVEESDLPRQGVRVGAGIQSGPTFVGVLGSGDKLDFSALGDVVNTAARLGAMAGPGELLVAADAWRTAGLSESGLVARMTPIAGRTNELEMFALSERALVGGFEPARMKNRT